MLIHDVATTQLLIVKDIYLSIHIDIWGFLLSETR